MLISVIIPTFNRSNLLSECLNLLSYEIQRLETNHYEVIVSDDSDNDKTYLLIQEKYKWVKWVAGPQKGPAANRNKGASIAQGSWFIFIDDDCLPDKNLIRNYIYAILKNPEVLAYEGKIIPDNWDLLKKDLSQCPVNINGDCFWSANICINAFLFKKINGFDESYLIAAQEDQQIKIDIQHLNYKIVFLERCVVVHPVRITTFTDNLARIPISSKNYSKYAYKNRNILKCNSIIIFYFKDTLFHLKQAFLYLKQFKIKDLLISLIWILFGVPLNTINYYKMLKGEYNSIS